MPFRASGPAHRGETGEGWKVREEKKNKTFQIGPQGENRRNEEYEEKGKGRKGESVRKSQKPKQREKLERETEKTNRAEGSVRQGARTGTEKNESA